jgi:hypothetical protein
MHDKTLFFAENQRPATIPTFGWLAQPLNRAMFPSNAAPNFIDRGSLMDPGRGVAIYANFRVTTTFTATAGNELRFCVLASNDPSFADILSKPENVIVASRAFTSAQLVAGLMVRLAIPPISEVDSAFPASGNTRLFYGLGIEYQVPATDWVAGGVDAWVSNYAVQARPIEPAPVGAATFPS